jgi:hypothetical protein
MLVVVVVLLPVVLAYTAWVFRVLRRRITSKSGAMPALLRRDNAIWYFSWILGLGLARKALACFPPRVVRDPGEGKPTSRPARSEMAHTGREPRASTKVTSGAAMDQNLIRAVQLYEVSARQRAFGESFE